jgi:hypothetical protein
VEHFHVVFSDNELIVGVYSPVDEAMIPVGKQRRTPHDIQVGMMEQVLAANGFPAGLDFSCPWGCFQGSSGGDLQ